jgi:hypothetical protein
MTDYVVNIRNDLMRRNRRDLRMGNRADRNIAQTREPAGQQAERHTLAGAGIARDPDIHRDSLCVW